jgi:hypothetical protein
MGRNITIALSAIFLGGANPAPRRPGARDERHPGLVGRNSGGSKAAKSAHAIVDAI